MAEYPGASQDKKTPRIIAIGVILSGIILLYLGQLFTMQIINNVRFAQDATQISQKSVPIPAKRGEIFDRNHNTPLVQNIDSFQINFNPAEATSDAIPHVLSRLSQLLKVPFDQLDQKVPSNLYKSFQTIELKKGVDYQTVARIAEHKEDFLGVSWESNPIRNYLNIGSLAHVIGYVGNINQEELQVLYNQGYGMRSVVGKSGIEKNFDLVLRGKEGTRFRTVDVNGRNVDSTSQDQIIPESGKDIVLTID